MDIEHTGKIYLPVGGKMPQRYLHWIYDERFVPIPVLLLFLVAFDDSAAPSALLRPRAGY